MKVNALEQQLYGNALIAASNRRRFDRGMFISINNHKQTTDTLVASLKKQYEAILYALSGKNIGRGEAIRVTDKVPVQEVLLDVLAAKKIVVAAAIHSYDAYDIRTGRGSNRNYGGYNHMHFYVFGVDALLERHSGGVDAGVEHIRRVLYRHNKFAKSTNNANIDIREVGVGKYQYSDVVLPTTLYQYLSLPKSNPSKDCIINYMAGTRDGGALNPVLYIISK
jgi:hypothetical protein